MLTGDNYIIVICIKSVDVTNSIQLNVTEPVFTGHCSIGETFFILLDMRHSKRYLIYARLRDLLNWISL